MLLEGLVICGKWQIARLIGGGGMGAVYAAKHRNGKRVAIKVLHDELRANAHVRARFLREGYIANRVDHPDVVSVLDDGETDDGDVFLVMDLLEGETLEARRKVGNLSLAAALSIAESILDVLAKAHDAGVVHRDIKPANIFLTTVGSVKVLDFGIASVREVLAGSNSMSTLTPTGACLGTPSFMAPEQARGRSDLVDARTDLWAVGAVLFTLLAGRLVHQGVTANELLIAAATAPAPPVSSLCRSLPADVAQIVDRALCLDRERRWQDARAMQTAVRAAIANSERDSQPIVSFGSEVAPEGATLPETQHAIAQQSGKPPRMAQPSSMVWPGIGAALALAGLAALGIYGKAAGGYTHPGAMALTAPLSRNTMQAPPRGSPLTEASPSATKMARAPTASGTPDSAVSRPSSSAQVPARAVFGASRPAAKAAPVRKVATAAPLWSPDSEWLDQQK